MRALALVPVVALTALLASGCGEESANGDEGAGAATEAAPVEGAGTATSSAKKKRKGTRVKVVGSEFGRVLADRRGKAFYLFDLEKSRKSRCYGACAKAWPPLLTKGRPVAIGGAKQRLLGTTKRRNGKRQVTYAGHPLYYYVHDSPGQILCHDVFEFGGDWLVVRPNGRPAP